MQQDLLNLKCSAAVWSQQSVIRNILIIRFNSASPYVTPHGQFYDFSIPHTRVHATINNKAVTIQHDLIESV